MYPPSHHFPSFGFHLRRDGRGFAMFSYVSTPFYKVAAFSVGTRTLRPFRSRLLAHCVTPPDGTGGTVSRVVSTVCATS